MREHGSLKLGGGIYERTWVSQARWEDIWENMGLLSWVGDIWETMGFSSWVGGYMREHGSLKLGGGYTRDHGSLKLGGRIYERTWVSKARWEDIWENIGLPSLIYTFQSIYKNTFIQLKKGMRTWRMQSSLNDRSCVKRVDCKAVEVQI